MNQAIEHPTGPAPPSWLKASGLGLMGVACFHAAYSQAKSGPLALLIIGYVVCLVQLARLRTTRQCFYSGLAVGIACYAPQLECFWRIFGPAAIALWLVLAFWIALFLALSHLALGRLGPKRAALLVPFLWTGLEYFRSELYHLRFSWLNVGYAFAGWPRVPIGWLGMYGLGFVVAVLATLFFLASSDPIQTKAIRIFAACVTILGLLAALLLPGGSFYIPQPDLVIGGIQLEFPDEKQILQALDKMVAAQPNMRLRAARPLTNVDLIVLSEYTLDTPPPERLKEWCRTNQKFLIVGGKDPAPNNNFYNSAYVISTNGEVVFKQVKCVPIQFFKDGLPATGQKLWESPWGRIGICICYDLSYARVTDELVRQGAQMLVVPTMDVADWGRHQHELHARVALVRAAEYGIPIFRLASSGISQGVSRWRRQNVTAPFPGESEMIFFGPTVSGTGSLPMDRWLAPISVGVTGLFVVWLAVENLRRRRARVLNGNPA